MIVTVIPQPDIIQIVKVFRLAVDSKDDDNDNDEGALKAGQYCVDSVGRFWREDPDLGAILAAIDFDDKQLTRERIEARKKKRKSKKRPRRVS